MSALSKRVAFALMLFSAASLETARASPVVAVANFRYAGINESSMFDYIDLLAAALSETGVSVVRRADRDERLRMNRPGGQSDDYAEHQRLIGEAIGVDAVVAGDITSGNSGMRLEVTVLWIVSGGRSAVLSEVYGGNPELNQDVYSVASEIAFVLDPPPPVVREPRDIDTVLGFRLTQAGVSGTDAVIPGSYLAVEVFSEINAFAISARYATSLFPDSFGEHLVGLDTGFLLHPAEDIYISLAIGGLLDIGSLRWHVGVSVTPVYSGNIGKIAIEILPFSVYYDFVDNRVLVTLELITIGFLIID